MFCPNCGNEIKGGKNFCPVCGTPLDIVQDEELFGDQNVNEYDAPSQEPYYPQNENVYNEPNQEPYYSQNENMYNEPYQESYYSQNDDYYDTSYYSDYRGMGRPKKGFNKLFLIPIIGVPVVAIILCLFFFTGIFGGAKGTAESYLDSLAERNADKFIESSLPEEAQDRLLNKECDGDESKMEEKAEREIDDIVDDCIDEYYFDVNKSYSLEKMGEFSDEAIDEINRDLDNEDMDLECTEGVFYRIEQDGAKSLAITVAKVNGSWCALRITGADGIKDKYID